MLGYDSPTELVGKPVMEFVHPDDRALVLARIRRVVVEGRPGELVEERFCRKDGTYLPVEVINAPFFWLGQPAVQVVVRDISERKALSRAAEEAVLQMQAILSHSPDGIAAESDGRIVYANWRFARIYGYDGPGQVANRPVTDFVSERDRARVAEYSLRRARGEPAPNHYTFQGRRRDGSSVEIEITVSAYSVRDKQFILGFLRPAAM
jgi:PAS domain S-box-containing protein